METPKMVVFVVKRYAVREAEKWRYAVRKAKIGRYAVYQGGGGVTLMYVVFIVWMGVKHTHSNFGVARFLRITLHLMQFITYSLYFRGMVRM